MHRGICELVPVNAFIMALGKDKASSPAPAVSGKSTDSYPIDNQTISMLKVFVSNN